MRQRKSGSRPHKRVTGNMIVFPSQHRSTPARELDARLDHGKSITSRPAMQVLAPSGLRNTSTISHTRHDFAYVDLYVLNGSEQRVVLGRSIFAVVIDAYSGLILEVKCLAEATSTKSTAKAVSLSPRVKNILEKYFTGLRPIVAPGGSPDIIEQDCKKKFSTVEARARYRRRGIVIHDWKPKMSHYKKVEANHAKTKAKKPRS